MLTFLLVFIIGLCVGSFLNVVICRLPEKRSIVKNRSSCPHCKEIIKPYDLLPLVSFCVLKGQCRQCKKKISWQYPIIELVTGLVFTAVAYYYQTIGGIDNPLLVRDLVLLSALIVVFATDLKYMLIFDAVTVPMMVFAFAANIFLLGNSTNYLSLSLNYLAAGIIGAGFFFLQHYFSKGKWIGAGDIRLGLLMGLILGWPNIFVALFLAYIVGAICSLILIVVSKKKMDSQIPFGVFLSLATAFAMFWG
ncbi:MAG: prepilin peptidase, partial [Patescibacteria group bacterium]